MNSIIKEPVNQATHCMIWMHGLGASNQDMAGLVDALNLSELPIRHVCLQAADRAVTINAGMHMPAWYDIMGNELTDREDKLGIAQSNLLIENVIKEQEAAGIPTSKIFLAGFSQGGAMAFYSALNCSHYLAGVVALSCYLPLATECVPKQRKSLPMFIAYGSMDPVVKPQWSKMSYDTLIEKGFTRMSLKDYPMMHEISSAEINDLRQWIITRVN